MSSKKKKQVKKTKESKNIKSVNKKVIFTFNETADWYTQKIGSEVDSYNFKVSNNAKEDKALGWWDGIFAFNEHKNEVAKLIESKNEIIVVANKFFGVYSGFILSLICLAINQNKKVIMLTSNNIANELNLIKYLSNIITIYDCMEPTYRESIDNSSLFQLENQLNNIYIKKLKEYTQKTTLVEKLCNLDNILKNKFSVSIETL